MLNFNGKTPKKILYNGKNVAKLIYNNVVVWLAKILTKIIGKSPITLENSTGDDLVSFKIAGNTEQNGAPTPDNPQEINAVGDLETSGEHAGKYKIPVKISGNNHEPETKYIYLNEPLMTDEILNSDGNRDVKWVKLVLTGDEKWSGPYTITNVLQYYTSGMKLDGNGGSAIYSNITPFGMTLGHRQSGGTGCYFLSNGTDVAFNMFGTGIDTVDDFKTLLKTQYENGTPVIIWFELSEPTTAPVEIPTIPTFDGTTIVSVDTEIQPDNVELEYYKK